jgi:hypothetical protein
MNLDRGRPVGLGDFGADSGAIPTRSRWHRVCFRDWFHPVFTT